MQLTVAGENSFIIYFAKRASPTTSACITATAEAVKQQLGPILIDLIPSYGSLLVIYDALEADHLWVRKRLQDVINQGDHGRTLEATKIELPVYYSPASGPDLERLAKRANLSVEAVINLHQQTQYQVYAIGFAPGFAYLGEVDERIAAPRLATPRLRVPQGAVAIADRQTAVYPTTSPGGWNLIGLCPVRLFDPQAETPMPVKVGDQVSFKAIDKAHFLKLGGVLPDAASALTGGQS